jgi:hypothetical protein
MWTASDSNSCASGVGRLVEFVVFISTCISCPWRRPWTANCCAAVWNEMNLLYVHIMEAGGEAT